MNSDKASCRVAETSCPVWRCARSNVSTRTLRHDRVSHPNIGQHHLGEGADVEYAACGIEALQGCHGSSLVMKLAVVVVLDQHGADSRRKAQQLHPPIDRHQPAGRILMRRRDEDELRPVPAAGQHQAAAVERNTDDAGPDRFKRHTGAAIAGVLQPSEIPGFQGHPGDQLDRRLRRRRDDDLTRLGPDAAVLDEMACQGLLQRRTVVGAAAAPRGAARGAAQASPPDVVRKRPRIGQAGNERPSRTFAGKRPVGLADAARPEREPERRYG